MSHENLNKLIAPEQDRALALWQGLRASRKWPARDEIDILNLWSAMGRMMIVDVIHDAPLNDVLYRYRLVGTWVVARIGREMTGQTIGSFDASWQTAMVRALYDRVLRIGAPVLAKRRICVRNPYMVYSLLALPLGITQDAVDKILCVFAPAPGYLENRINPFTALRPSEIEQTLFDVPLGTTITPTPSSVTAEQDTFGITRFVPQFS